MPCLSNLLDSAPSALPDLKPVLNDSEINPIAAGEPDPEPQSSESNDDIEHEGNDQGGGAIEMSPTPESDLQLQFSDGGAGKASKPCIRVKGPTLMELVQEWAKRKIEQGVPEYKCTLPFLVGAPKMIQCGACQKGVYPEEKISCSVRGCRSAFHLACAKESLSFSFSSSKKKQFKCPQHHKVPASTIEDIFSVLPLPYIEEEFKIDINWKDEIETETKLEPHPYTHIKRNMYLVKKKRNSIDTDNGCTNCSSTRCSDGCECRVQCISCSNACSCSKECANRPFQKAKKIQIVKTELCGWGVVAAEPISKEDFVVEYVGEVIDDVLCEKRLWDMKDQDSTNFYMCEINKDFVIDATFKGNASRFLNHSCAPNCKLEKWQVEGETRVGVFASRSIEVGEPLTYDYRFVQFGPQVPCHCGAPNCRGYLGTRKKIVFAPKAKRKDLKVSWGPKRQRTTKQTIGMAMN
ncbi:hypothetical protein ACS0TY_024825 [Phlomoides rotata]